jgi:hypothetical protein
MFERLGLVLLAGTLVFGFAPYFYALGDILSDTHYKTGGFVPALIFAVIVAGIIAAFHARRPVRDLVRERLCGI